MARRFDGSGALVPADHNKVLPRRGPLAMLWRQDAPRNKVCMCMCVCVFFCACGWRQDGLMPRIRSSGLASVPLISVKD